MRNKVVQVKDQYLNMLSTNTANLTHKGEDLKNKVRLFNSGIFAVQETHFRKKGRFKMQDFIIFESIRKNKEKEGSMLGVHVGLKPVLIQEYCTTFELLVVEVIVADKEIRVITGYGPQENWEIGEKTPFYNALEEEIAAAEILGKSVILTLDANAKLGPKIIQGNPYMQTPNGAMLAGIVDRHALCVVNGLVNKRKGIITRKQNTVLGVKMSVIAFGMVSDDLKTDIVSIHIDEERVNVLTKNRKTKNGIEHSESDHNLIMTKMKLTWSPLSSKVVEVLKFKDKDAKVNFKKATTETNELSQIIDKEKPLDLVTKQFIKRLQGFIHDNFKKGENC